MGNAFALASRTVAIFAVVLGIMAASSPAAAGLVADIRERGTIKVGMSTFVPWAMRDRQGGLIGFEIDVATKLAEDMGVEVEFMPTAWSTIIPALLEERFDVIIGGMSITPERSLKVDFSVPYARSGQQLAASRKLAGGFRTIDDFNQPGVIIACRRGTTSCLTAQDVFPKTELSRFDNDARAVQEVLDGNAHAAVSSEPQPAFWSEANPDDLFVALGGMILAGGEEAFAIRKGDPGALDYFSGWILEHRRNGWLEKRHDYWFKGREAWIGRVAPNQ